MIEKVQLKIIAQVQAGYHLRTQVRSDPNGSYMLVQGKNINTKNEIAIEYLTRFFPERKIEPYLIRKGDVLVQAKGNMHYAVCFTSLLENIIAADTFYIVRLIGKTVQPEFLVWWINQISAQAYLVQNSGGTGIPFISRAVLEEMTIPVPPIETQTMIVEVDHLWRRQKDLQKLLDDKKELLIQSICLQSIKKESTHE